SRGRNQSSPPLAACGPANHTARPLPSPGGAAPMSDQGQGHYATVVRSIAEGRVVPLLGAGVNLASRPKDTAWQQGKYLPNGYELAKHLTELFPFPAESDMNLLRVS